MDNGKKNTLQVFTSNDIRKHARYWTLAGDAGLLAHLEQFSENIINKTEETQKNFSEVVNDFEELYTKVGNVTNQFLALQNCQFVENRVYDEETPTEDKTDVKVQDEADQENLLLMQYKEAVEVGVKLLDTHFQEIQLPPNSDSDEEDEVTARNSVIWKPKNAYASKKFPLLIGSEEWWANDHVGLRANEELFDLDKNASESDSEMESLNIEKPLKSSSSSIENMITVPTKTPFLESSEDLFGFNKSKNFKPEDLSKDNSSLLEEPTNFLPDFDKEPIIESNEKIDSYNEDQSQQEQTEKPENEAASNKLEKVNNEFTRELMAKLVSVTNKINEEKEPEKVTKRSTPTEYETDQNLFDETDDSGDLFSTKPHSVLERPAAKKNLFFDAENDDELFKDKNGLFSGGSLKDTKSQSNGQKGFESSIKDEVRTRKEVVEAKNVVKDLFEDLDEEDNLFSVKSVNNKKVDQSLPSMEDYSVRPEEPLGPPGAFWNNDEGLFDNINTKIDQDFFSSSDLFDDKPRETDSKISAPEKSTEKVADFPPKEQKIKGKPENVEDILRKETSDSGITKRSTAENSFEDIFGFSSTAEQGNKKISILDSEENDDLFSKTLKEEKKLPVKIATLSDVEDDSDVALFGEKSKPPDSISVSSSRSSLFDDMSASKSRLASVFEKDKSSKAEGDLFNGADDSLFARETKPQKDLFSTKGKEKSSLFDDCDDGDDLFGGKEGTGDTSSSGKSVKSIKEDLFEIGKKQKGVESVIDDLDDDLFKTSGATTKPKETKNLEHSDQTLFGDDLDDSELFFEKAERTKPKPPSSLSLKATETESKGKTVGKLNIPDNLKVRLESVANHISQKRPISREEKSTEEKKEDVLDESVQVSNLLKCPSKDRVKIPGRRRPQSRRARQEAIRNSGTWDQVSPGSTSKVTPTPKDSSSPIVSNPLSPSTDEEDFFKVPELDTNFEKEDQRIFKSDLFESSKTSKLDDSLLFNGAPVLSPPTEEPERKDGESGKTQQTDSLLGAVKSKKTLSIFDDFDLDGDDENLFKTSKAEVDKSVSGQTRQKSEGKVKKPLFELDDNDDDNDDLFGGTSHVTLKSPAHDKPKGGDEPKEKKYSSFVDPLGLNK